MAEQQNKITEKARKIEVAEISTFAQVATDSSKVTKNTVIKEQMEKETKATGGFGWGVTVTIFVLFVLVVGFLYLKYK